MKKIIMAMCLMASISTYANSINIQCEYDFFRTNDFKEFVKKEIAQYWWQADFYKKHEWWEFWKKRIIYFSIDLETKGVTGGLGGDGLYFPSDTSADIYPDQILLKQKFEYIDHPHHKHLSRDFNINRLNGDFFGSYYEIDEKTDKDVNKYSMRGRCKRIERLF